jgi:outer membrane lipoprotein-sorting protein
MKHALAALLFAVAATAAAPAQTQPPALTAAAAAYAKISGYSTTAHVYQVKDSQTQNSVYNYTFAKPTSVTMNIVSGPNSGATVTWTGGTSVRAGKGMFTKTVDLTDPLVLSLRGMTIVALSFGAILQHAAETAGALSASTTTLGGASVNLVNLDVANPQGDNGLTREVLYLSQSTNLPVRVDGFIGSTLVQTVSFENTALSS